MRFASIFNITRSIAEMRRLFLAKGVAQLAPADAEILGENAGFTDGCDETRVAGPAREHVHVDVTGDSSAGALAEIHPEIEPTRFVDLAQVTLGVARERHHFLEGVIRRLLEQIDVLVRHNHQVPGGVRKAIENDEIEFGAMDDQRLSVILGRGKIAENAGRARMRRGDVLVTPGRPQVVHNRIG